MRKGSRRRPKMRNPLGKRRYDISLHEVRA
jgi:hypothetical protein